MLGNTGLHVLFGSLVALVILAWIACLVYMLRLRTTPARTFVGYTGLVVFGLGVVAFIFIVVIFWSEKARYL